MKSERKHFVGSLALIITVICLVLGTTARAAGLVAAWGNNDFGQTTVPSGLGPVRAIAAGGSFSAALKLDGSVVVWGNPTNGMGNMPAGLDNVKAVSAGRFHLLALKADGNVVAWGDNSSGQTNVPPGLFGVVEVAGGVDHNLALKFDGTAVAWGNNDHGQSTVPATVSNVVSLAAGFWHNLALKSDGTVVVWGDNSRGQTNLPAGLSNVVAVAAGYHHSLAVLSDGTVQAWGDGFNGQTAVPAGLSNVVAIAAGLDRSLALKSDGTVVAWGDNASGQSSVPAGLSATAIAVGGLHNLALTPDGPIQIIQNPQGQIVTYSSNATMSVVVAGTQPIRFQWKLNGSNLVDNAHVSGSSNAMLTINNLLFSDAGNYSVVMSNALGSMVSSTAVLSVISPPLILQQTSNQTVRAGTSLTFSVSAIGSPVLSYQWQYGGTNITGATNSSLILVNVQPSASGNYVLTISNLYGLVQGTISLVVTDSAPYILQQPAGKNVALGGATTFSVTARGSLPLSYQWRFNGDDIPGATSSVLNLSNLNYGQTGFYNVVISNAFGEVISAKALLSVLETVVWGGASTRFPTNVPPGLSNLVAISAGTYHTLGLKGDGTVVTWYSTSVAVAEGASGVTNIPIGLTNVTAISAGGLVCMALKSDGKVLVWGNNISGQTNVPAGLTNLSGIAAGSTHCLALRSNGTVTAWGSNSNGQTNVPVGLSNVIAVAAGTSCSMALRANGTVVAWGGISAESRVPAGLSNVVAIAAGNGHCMALNANGTAIGWSGSTASHPPSSLSNAVAIAAAGSGGIALKQDGSVVTWGTSQTPAPPTGLTNVFAITSGGLDPSFYVALIGSGRPIVTVQPFSQVLTRGTDAQLTALAVGRQPMSCQWEHDGLIIPGATNTSLVFANIQGKDTGGYRLNFSNALGITNSTMAFLTIPFTNTLAQALNATNLPWTSLSNTTTTSWFPQIKVSHDNDSAAQSGAITDGRQSLLQTTVTGPGTVTFWWKVSSEEGFDFLKFSVDSTEKSAVAISGDVDWEERTYTVPSGTHSLGWFYTKDVSVSDGLDAGWVDQVVYTPAPIQIVQQPVSQTVIAGTNVTFSVQATGTVALAYQWVKDGTNISGATATSLTLSSVTASSAGLYAVKVSNGAQTVLSSNAVLTVSSSQLLSRPAVQSDGTYSLTSQYADGSSMGSNSLGGFDLQASVDLINWTTLTNPPVLVNGVLQFKESGITNYTRRFYRVVQKQ